MSISDISLTKLSGFRIGIPSDVPLAGINRNATLVRSRARGLSERGYLVSEPRFEGSDSPLKISGGVLLHAH